ncbi:MAG: DUF4124 domain-containing protein [Gammaproteobacteria bacterium]|nr:DUF4124 domain-containing protein [Gammaproteobacteria bacterium]MCP5424412.1 DUF4124 domain-containing protein [Gammaproteobacteria bacterium]MCP5458406.1 DUF4124 domain-containing protein [Gammaproteobacteria bacterium]
MRLKLIAFSIVATLAIQVHADVYQCDKDGQTVYQQTPCETQGNKLEMDYSQGSSSGSGDSENNTLGQSNKSDDLAKEKQDGTDEGEQTIQPLTPLNEDEIETLCNERQHFVEGKENKPCKARRNTGKEE